MVIKSNFVLAVMKILNEHREKVKSGYVQPTDRMKERPDRPEVRQSNILEEVTYEDSKTCNENWHNS